MDREDDRGGRSQTTPKGVSRRGFLKTVGASTAAVAACRVPAAAKQEKEIAAQDLARIALEVNGRRHRLLVEARWSLLFVLREKLGLSGSKAGCERGECGACTVLIEDVPRYACLTLAVEAAGKKITTVEGLMQGEELGDVQKAFVTHDAFQCGYCTPGQIMAVEGLLRKNPAPSGEDIRLEVSGNLCRCGAYPNIFAAAKAAAETRRTRP